MFLYLCTPFKLETNMFIYVKCCNVQTSITEWTSYIVIGLNAWDYINIYMANMSQGTVSCQVVDILHLVKEAAHIFGQL